MSNSALSHRAAQTPARQRVSIHETEEPGGKKGEVAWTIFVWSCSVRVNLQTPGSSEMVRYVVKGRSPVWVYRQDDYQRSQNWQSTE
jgi:hypothetical protein